MTMGAPCEDAQAGGGKHRGDVVGEGGLGAYHCQVDAVLQGEVAQRLRAVLVNSDQLYRRAGLVGDGSHSGVAGGDKDFGFQARLRQFPGDGVLTATASDN